MSKEPSGAVTVLPQRAEVTDCQCLDNRAAREREREPGAACWFLFSRTRREEREGEEQLQMNGGGSAHARTIHSGGVGL